MPDITMCTGEGCPFKDKCYNYFATPWARQSYFLEVPFKNGNCDHYNPLMENDEKTQKRVKK